MNDERSVKIVDFPGPRVGASEHTELHYDRYGEAVRLRITSMTSHELRALLIGLWLRFDAAERIDVIRELQHYLTPGSKPPVLSQVIGDESGLLS